MGSLTTTKMPIIILSIISLIFILFITAADCTIIAGTSTAAIAIDVTTVIAAFVAIASAVIRAS